MSINIKTVTFEGIDAIAIEVQVHMASGLPCLNIIGLGDKAVKESKDRVKSAISSLGLSIPAQRITINLSPADIIKEGTHFDLPIAIGILCAMNIVKPDAVDNYLFLGELALDGRVLSVNGILPSTIYAHAMNYGLVCPSANKAEGAIFRKDMDIIAAENLLQVINHFNGKQFCPKINFNDTANLINSAVLYGDLYDVRGQFAAKRALEVAACGGHSMLMLGPPGTGKSMLASRIRSILPDMSPQEILESSIIRSVAGELKNNTFSNERPYRDPHHSASMPAMIGGGKNAMPGEISLAHNGILFLDELPEFPRQILDSLRQPMENGYINVSRVNKHVTYPAKFQLIAAMNPCKCGYFGKSDKECKKTPLCAQEYQAKISGPIMDRIDLHVEVGSFVPKLEDDGSDRGERSFNVRQRVIEVREIQKERYKNEDFELNVNLVGDCVKKYCVLTEKASLIFKNAVEKLDLSMRSYNKILKTARTIADMNKSELIDEKSILESLAYRSKIIKVR